MKQIYLLKALLFPPALFGTAKKQQQSEIFSSPEADAVISYFQQCPESPDGIKAAFTIFHSPDSMEVVMKILANGELKSVNKIKGQHRHSGKHPVWADN